MKHSCKITSIEDSPLFKKILDATKKYGDEVNGIWISITQEAEEYSPEDEDKTYFVKWLSWSLIDHDNRELLDASLVFVHGDLTEQHIKNDLSSHFPCCRIIVDNEIYFE